jgi:hypothetical protein
MRTLSPWLMATVLLAGCEQSSSLVGPEADEPSLANKTVQHITETFPVDGAIGDACLGEDVVFAGTIRNAITIVSEPGNDDHISFQGLFVGTGTGTVTGTKYLVNNQFHFSFNTPSLTAPQGYTMTLDQIRAVSQGGSDNLFFSFDLHIVFLPSGEVKTTVENFTGGCTG